jgi:hypothetical protein
LCRRLKISALENVSEGFLCLGHDNARRVHLHQVDHVGLELSALEKRQNLSHM